MTAHIARTLSHNELTDNPLSNQIKFLWLELTRKCNLECIHCYENSSPRLPLHGTLSTEDWIQILEQAADLGVKKVQFIGGEPTLYRDLDQLIEKATKRGVQVEIYTNGTAINEHLWSVFVTNQVSLAFSYYSTDPEQHDLVTTKSGSHQKTRAAIVRALKHGLTVRVGVIQMHDVDDTSVQSAIAELRSIGVRNVGSDRTRGLGRGVRQLSTKLNPFGELCGHCGEGKIAIDNNGNVYPCVFSKFSPLGHVRSGLDQIVRGMKMGIFLDKLSAQHSETKREESGPCFPTTCVPHENCNPHMGCIPDNGCSP